MKPQSGAINVKTTILSVAATAALRQHHPRLRL
jgi:hypothetical protein